MSKIHEDHHTEHHINTINQLLYDSQRILYEKEARIQDIKHDCYKHQSFTIEDNLNELSKQLAWILNDLETKSNETAYRRVSSAKSTSSRYSDAFRQQRYPSDINEEDEFEEEEEEEEPEQELNRGEQELHRGEQEGIRRHKLHRNAYESLTLGESTDESASDDTPVDLLNQLNGYINSTDMDINTKSDLKSIIQSTTDTVGVVPINKENTKQLNRFITNLEGCIGSFTD